MNATTTTEPMTITKALEEVQKAYRLVYDFSMAMQDTLKIFLNNFDKFEYYYRNIEKTPRNSSPLSFQPSYAVPTNYYAILYSYTDKGRSDLCQYKNDALLSCEVYINSAIRGRVEEKPYIDLGLYIASDDAPLPGERNGNNWYSDIWETTDYPASHTSQTHNSKPYIQLYREIILIELLDKPTNIEKAATEFKQRAENALRGTIQILIPCLQ